MNRDRDFRRLAELRLRCARLAERLGEAAPQTFVAKIEYLRELRKLKPDIGEHSPKLEHFRHKLIEALSKTGDDSVVSLDESLKDVSVDKGYIGYGVGLIEKLGYREKKKRKKTARRRKNPHMGRDIRDEDN